MVFGKRIQNYFQFGIIELPSENLCNTSQRLYCSIIFNYHSQSLMAGFFFAFDWHAWSNSPVLGGLIMSVPMKTNTGCTMDPTRLKKQGQKVSKLRLYFQRCVPGLSRLPWDWEAPWAAHTACAWRTLRGVGNPICSLHQAAGFMPVFKTFSFCIMEKPKWKGILSAKRLLRSD